MNNQKLYVLVAFYESIGMQHKDAVDRAMAEYVAVKKLLAQRDSGADLTKAAGVACCEGAAA